MFVTCNEAKISVEVENLDCVCDQRLDQLHIIVTKPTQEIVGMASLHHYNWDFVKNFQ